jgi:hypothetical protein
MMMKVKSWLNNCKMKCMEVAVLVQEVVERTPINLWMTEAQGFGRQMKDSMDS